MAFEGFSFALLRAAVRTLGNLLNDFLSLLAQVKEFLCNMTV